MPHSLGIAVTSTGSSALNMVCASRFAAMNSACMAEDRIGKSAAMAASLLSSRAVSATNAGPRLRGLRCAVATYAQARARRSRNVPETGGNSSSDGTLTTPTMPHAQPARVKARKAYFSGRDWRRDLRTAKADVPRYSAAPFEGVGDGWLQALGTGK
jgi:hypothetical protein